MVRFITTVNQCLQTTAPSNSWRVLELTALGQDRRCARPPYPASRGFHPPPPRVLGYPCHLQCRTTRNRRTDIVARVLRARVVQLSDWRRWLRGLERCGESDDEELPRPNGALRCTADLPQIITSTLQRATVTGLVFSGFGLSAFIFSAIAHAAFPGDTSSFLLVLAVGTAFPMLIGYFFIKVITVQEATKDHDPQTPLLSGHIDVLLVDTEPNVSGWGLCRNGNFWGLFLLFSICECSPCAAVLLLMACSCWDGPHVYVRA